MAYVQVRRALCRVARRVQVQWLGGIGLASRERPRCAGAAAKVDRPEERAKGGPRLNLGWWAWALACSGGRMRPPGRFVAVNLDGTCDLGRSGRPL